MSQRRWVSECVSQWWPLHSRHGPGTRIIFIPVAVVFVVGGGHAAVVRVVIRFGRVVMLIMWVVAALLIVDKSMHQNIIWMQACVDSCMEAVCPIEHLICEQVMTKIYFAFRIAVMLPVGLSRAKFEITISRHTILDERESILTYSEGQIVCDLKRMSQWAVRSRGISLM